MSLALGKFLLTGGRLVMWAGIGMFAAGYFICSSQPKRAPVFVERHRPTPGDKVEWIDDEQGPRAPITDDKGKEEDVSQD